MRGVQVAVLQYCAGPDQASTLPLVKRLITEAADNGAAFICLPECANFLAKDRTVLRELAEDEASSPSLSCLQQLAKTYQVHISAGSLMMRADNDDRHANRGYLIGPDGAILAHYNKIHMFDADVGDGKQYRESEQFKPGDRLVHHKTEIGHIGLSICYDIRFPHLYRHLGQAGAVIISIPAALPRQQGSCGMSCNAPGRLKRGVYSGGSATWRMYGDEHGHSLIINPRAKFWLMLVTRPTVLFKQT